MVSNLTREQLDKFYDKALARAERLDPEDYGFGHAWSKENELRARLRTICQNCGVEGAEDHYDTHGIYAGRWHEQCATPADRHRENYRWSPGDEPLEES